MVPVSSRPRSTLTARPTATEFNFDSDEDFMAYIEDLRSRSEFTSDVEIQGSPPFKPWCRLFLWKTKGKSGIINTLKNAQLRWTARRPRQPKKAAGAGCAVRAADRAALKEF